LDAVLAVAGCGGSKKSATGTQPSNPVQLTLGSVVTDRVDAGGSLDYAVRLAPGAQAVASLIDSTGAATLASIGWERRCDRRRLRVRNRRINHPSPTSMFGNLSTSRRNARSASALVL